MNSPLPARYTLHCPECGETFDPTTVQTYCHSCSSPILARYPLETLRAQLNRGEISTRPRGMWRWRELLPVNDACHVITLGEGDTPLLRLPKTSAALSLPGLLLKDEALNPTGTFKARGMAVAVSRAVELGITQFVIPSAGNAGGALASYAAHAGCGAHVYLPADTPAPIQYEVRMSGAQLHLVDGDHRLVSQVPFIASVFGSFLDKISLGEYQ